MPGDVAVEGPDSGVVRIELEHDVTVGSDDLSVAAQRVIRVGDGGAVPSSFTLGQDLNVGAVKMHGVTVCWIGG